MQLFHKKISSEGPTRCQKKSQKVSSFYHHPYSSGEGSKTERADSAPPALIGLTLSGPEDFDSLKGRGGGLIQPAGKRWPLEASEATVEATKQTNIVPDIFLYL